MSTTGYLMRMLATDETSLDPALRKRAFRCFPRDLRVSMLGTFWYCAVGGVVVVIEQHM